MNFRKYKPSKVAAAVIAAVRDRLKIKYLFPRRLEELTGYNEDELDELLFLLKR